MNECFLPYLSLQYEKLMFQKLSRNTILNQWQRYMDIVKWQLSLLVAMASSSQVKKMCYFLLPQEDGTGTF